MERIEVVWCEKPDESDESAQQPTNTLTFRVANGWVATDQEQLLLPIMLLGRDGTDLDEPVRAVLKQYGGEQILNSLLLEDADFEEGSEWMLTRTPTRRTIDPAD